MKTIRVPADGGGVQLRDFLSARLNCSKKRAKALLDQRRVFVNGRRVWMARHALRPGDEVSVPEEEKSPALPDIPPPLFRGDPFLVCNKPAGWLSNGPGSAEQKLRKRHALPALQAAHRLDRDTSGCLLCTLDEPAFKTAAAWFRTGEVEKEYRAIAFGSAPGPEWTNRSRLDGKSSLSEFRVLSTNSRTNVLLLAVRTLTGRTHQIRRHLERDGLILLGENRYGTARSLPSRWRDVPRHLLHARFLAFPGGDSGQVHEVRAPYPDDFLSWAGRCRLDVDDRTVI